MAQLPCFSTLGGWLQPMETRIPIQLVPNGDGDKILDSGQAEEAQQQLGALQEGQHLDQQSHQALHHMYPIAMSKKSSVTMLTQ